MKHWLPIALMWAVLTAVSEAGTQLEASASRDTATAYFEALMKGEADAVNAVVGVPFSFDRKEILQTREEVEKKHQQIVVKKGARKVPGYTASVPKKAPELDRAVFPGYEVFRINIEDGREHIDIYVTKGASPKVIGFSD
jgi:hypothetical protein